MTLVMQGASGISGKAYTTLLVLAHFADEESGVCWPGMKAIDFLARQSRKTTVLAITRLAAEGWIQIEKRSGRAGSNRYTLDFDRMRSESIRHAKPIRCKARRPSPNKPETAVEKPVEELCIPCGVPVDKPEITPVPSGDGSTRTIKESLENYRELQSKTGSTAADPELVLPHPFLPPDPATHRLMQLLGRLSRSAERGERGRGRAPGLSPPPTPSWT